MKSFIYSIFLFIYFLDLHAQALYQRQFAYHHEDAKNTYNYEVARYLYKSENTLLYAEANFYGETNNVNLLSLSEFEETPVISFGEESSIYIKQLLSDNEGNIYIYGVNHEGPNLATQGTYYTELLSTEYNSNTFFIAKYDENYNQLWFTYIPYGGHSIAVDNNQNVYFLSKQSKFTSIPEAPFQTNVEILTGDTNELKTIFGKLNANGELVWKSFLSYHNTTLYNIIASDSQVAIVGTFTKTTNNPIITPTFFSTEGALIETPDFQNNFDTTLFINSFDFDGNRVWGTYLSSNNSWVNFVNLIDTHENDFFIHYPSTEINTTLEPFYQLQTNDIPCRLTKFDQNGHNVWTHYGNNKIRNLAVDEIGDIWIGGFSSGQLSSYALQLNTNENSYQSSISGSIDAVHIKLSNDGENAIYNTYYGDIKSEQNHRIFPTQYGYISLDYTENNDAENTFYTHGPPLHFNQYFNNYHGMIITSFNDRSLTNTTQELQNIKIYPNPTNDQITIENVELFSESDSFEVYNTLGQKIIASKFESDYNKKLDCSNWSQGIYFLNVHSSGKTGTYKIIKQ